VPHGPPHQNTVGHRWRGTLTRAGLAGVKLHDLRHFYVSGLIAQGCDVVTVQRALPQAATIATAESTSSSSWTDLATVGPTVTAWVGTSRALALGSAEIIVAAGVSGAIAVSVDGAAPSGIGGNFATFGINGTTGGGASVSLAAIITGLSVGSHTFRMKYENNGSGSPPFSSRGLVVIPF